MKVDALECLPGLAIDTIAHTLRTGTRRLPAPDELPASLARPAATFVTLERDGDLLGCIGTLAADRPLGISVANSALGAAFDDPRLPPLTLDDYCVMQVKVSVLSEPAPRAVRSYEAFARMLEPGVDGVIVTRRGRQATFLPTVWTHLSDPASFLAALWRKAGLDVGAWDAHTRVATYTTAEFSDRGPRPRVRPDVVDA